MSNLHRMGRRGFLTCCASGGLALYPALALAAKLYHGHPLAPRPTHFPARAKNLIVVSLTGGFSHVDTFDYKPRLQADHGKKVFGRDLRDTSDQPFYLIRSPFQFSRRGRSGLTVSELFPHLGALADDLCVIRTLHTDILEHFQATLAMHTGSATVPMPSLGSWLSYGLGTCNRNLPPYVILAEHMPYAGAQNWDSSFLPPQHQGVRLLPGNEPIPDLRPSARSVSLQELEQLMLRDVNELHARERPHDLELRARSDSFETARGMMREAPEVFDVSRESDATLRRYGLGRGDNTSFAWQCLMARRLVERGVRVVELIDTGSSNNWDAHDDMQQHRGKALRVDRAVAALVKDLKQRGLLGETLVAGCTEFGRTPWGATPNDKGRNHHAKAFTCLLTGAGVKGGTAYGETDEYGINVASGPCHVHDYHATILHLMGIDHKKLTYRYAGRDFRLTDVHGNVLHSILT
ncbi:MAG TPA: DUF1501 domain-containing protein [Gemmataceae bacterium]|nr:DUF1501 domain-containing protein [Gemmataceae bacterium]